MLGRLAGGLRDAGAQAVKLLLRHLRWHSEGLDRHGDRRLAAGRVAEAGRGLAPRRGERVLDGAGLLALPGLINAHDHLGLDLLPRLGAGSYANAYEWARAIYRPDASPIREVLRVGLRDRLWWGAYRNLIAGVTTVVHHDPYYWWVFGRQWLGRRLVRRRLFGRRFPVRVLRRYAWCHSLGGPELGYGDDPVRAFRRAGARPFILHAAEGTDARASAEVDRLHELGLLGPSTVLVHAVAVDARQRELLAATGTGVVWCPASSLGLYGATAPVAALHGKVRIALGTDSTVTGSPTLFDELRVAASTGLVEPAALLEMVTTQAARIFTLDDGRGTLRIGAPADVLLLPDDGRSAAELLLAATAGDPELVLVGGRPRAASAATAEALALGAPNACVGGRPTWLYGDFARLRERIESVAGGDVLELNPVWTILSPKGGSR
jgi:cytosine/adenosine deaminase-related metal-dependent hydrolase